MKKVLLILILFVLSPAFAQEATTEQDIADKQAQLASLTSSVEMERRAVDLGFRPVAADEIVYLVVPGYHGRQTAVMAEINHVFVSTPPTLSPDFTISLLDWLQQKISLPPMTLESKLP